MTYNIKTGKEKYYSLNGVLFLDLKKAFDTVDHYILLEKLKLYGVDTPSLSWFTSYLSNRKQRTCVNGFFQHTPEIDSALYLLGASTRVFSFPFRSFSI